MKEKPKKIFIQLERTKNIDSVTISVDSVLYYVELPGQFFMYDNSYLSCEAERLAINDKVSSEQLS